MAKKSTKAKVTKSPALAAPARTVKAAARKKAAKPRAKAGVPIETPAHDPASSTAAVLDRLYGVVQERRTADPAVSHSARLLARGTAKVAQKFGEEAVECLIEAVAGNPVGLVGESADVLYHLLVLWVDAGIEPAAVWQELERREGVSGIAEKAARARPLAIRAGTRKIP
jgi:phosphoribosyl-ATP pyrophosphohydrolase